MSSADESSEMTKRLNLLDADFKSYLLKLDGIDRSDPRELIHYTSADAAQKILQTKLIRASDIFSMNDKAEISYGIEIVGIRLQSRPSIPPEIKVLFSPAEQGRLNNFMKKAKGWPVFIACFSTDRLLKSQWIDYADKGRGMAIVFDRERLYAQARVIGECSPFPMIYNEAEQRDVADTVAHMCEAHAANLPENQEEEYWSVAFSDLAIASFRFKAKRWTAEDEWRLFWLDPGAATKLRKRSATDATLVRFVEVGFTPAAITEIVLGPRTDARTQKRMRDLLSSVEYSHIKMTKSSVALRTALLRRWCVDKLRYVRATFCHAHRRT
jgi:hypothetical protein